MADSPVPEVALDRLRREIRSAVLTALVLGGVLGAAVVGAVWVMVARG